MWAKGPGLPFSCRHSGDRIKNPSPWLGRNLLFTFNLNTFYDILLRSTAIYLVILVGLRLAGKREIGQQTLLYLVVLLLIFPMLCKQNATAGPDITCKEAFWWRLFFWWLMHLLTG